MMSPGQSIPSDLIPDIAKFAVELDKTDRMWTLLTQLLRSPRGLYKWQEDLKTMERPVRWTFHLSEDRTLGKRHQSTLVEWDQHFSETAPRFEKDVSCVVIGPTGTKVTLSSRTRGFYNVIELDKRFPVGTYTAELKWDRNFPLSIALGPFHVNDKPHGIDSFGTQNVYSVCTSNVTTGENFYVPYVLSPHIQSLYGVCCHLQKFDCRSVEYWDLNQVKELRNFMRDTPNWKGDLSRYRLRSDQKRAGAFVGCGAKVWPPYYTSKQWRFWSKEFIVMHPSGVFVAFGLICAATVMVLVTSFDDRWVQFAWIAVLWSAVFTWAWYKDTLSSR